MENSETNQQKENIFVKFLEEATDEQTLMLFGSLISADNLLTKQNYEIGLQTVDKLIKALEEVNLPETKRNNWLKYAKDAKSIIIQEKDRTQTEQHAE